MTHRQALSDFPDTSQVSLHKNNKANETLFFLTGAENDVYVTVALLFISDRTALFPREQICHTGSMIRLERPVSKCVAS
jgi:hypothetical protein